VLSTIDREHLSLREACARFNIPGESVIISWRKAFEHNDPGLIYKPKGRPKKMDKPIKRKPRKSDKPLTREEELLKENEFLKAENALLKKLHALIQTVQKRKP
jgi:transposase